MSLLGSSGNFISNQERTSSLDVQGPLCADWPGAVSSELVTPQRPTLFISRSPTVIWLLLLISSCSGKGPGLSSPDDRVPSCAPESCPMLPGFTAGITQQDYPSTSASRLRPKLVKSCQMSALLCPAVVKGRQHIPISTAEGATGLLHTAHSTWFGLWTARGRSVLHTSNILITEQESLMKTTDHILPES